MAEQPQYASKGAVLRANHPSKPKASLSHAKADHKDTFDFQNLPAEIRNEIYGLVLVAQSSIKITRHEDKDASRRNTTKQMILSRGHNTGDTRVFYLHAGSTTTRRIRRRTKFTYAELHNPAILRVSQQINSEASGILYAQNKFAFEKPSHFGALMAMIGRHRHTLMDIAMARGEYLSGPDHEAFGMLRDASRLRHLEVTVLASNITVSAVARAVFTTVVVSAFIRFDWKVRIAMAMSLRHEIRTGGSRGQT